MQASLQRMPSALDRLLFNVYMLVGSRLGRLLQYNLTTHHICRSLSMTQSTSITALYCIVHHHHGRSGIVGAAHLPSSSLPSVNGLIINDNNGRIMTLHG